jgi:Na+-translocating ferredoxin:NAD+ oxidoreductase RNF subunit RnfB
MEILINALVAMTGLVVILTTVLWIAYRKLHVDEDQRIDAVEQALPNNNCGACGYAGCRLFAEAIIAGQAQPGQCTVSTPSQQQAIANFVGVALVTLEKRVARVACGGGLNVARLQANYQGLKTCRAATLAGGGGKACPWGCLGYGDCAEVCDFDAIVMDQFGIPQIVESACTACGDCVDACPKNLISLHPQSHRLWVRCSNQEEGDSVLDYCEVACNGCGRCVADAKPGHIQLQHFLARIDYGKADMDKLPIQRCPTGSIVWLHENGELELGRASKVPIRQSRIKAMPS